MRRKALDDELSSSTQPLFFADLSIKQQAPTRPMQASSPRPPPYLRRGSRTEEVALAYFGKWLSTSARRAHRDVEICSKAKQASTSAHRERLCHPPRPPRMFFLHSRMSFGRECLSRIAKSFRGKRRIYTGALNALTRLEGELDTSRNVDEAQRPPQTYR